MADKLRTFPRNDFPKVTENGYRFLLGLASQASTNSILIEDLQERVLNVINVKTHGVDPANIESVNTAGIAAAITAAGDGGCIEFSPGTYNGLIAIDGITGLLIKGNGAVLKGPSTGSINAILDIKNSVAINVENLFVHGNYNTGLTAGVWGYTDNSSQLSYCHFKNVTVTAAPIAWKFGHASHEDALISENMISGGYTYGCPLPIQLIGTQTVVDVNGYNLISGLNGGAGDYLTLPRRVAEVKGGHLNITGGECLITDSAADVCFNIEPITSVANGSPYGKISVANCVIESASQLAISYNPDSVTTPTGGMIRLLGCSGYHSSNSFSFIQTETDFSGKIIVKDCDFYAGVSRTQKNIECANDAADVYCDDHSFGSNFVQGLAGITGGTVHFTYRQILSVINLNGQSLPNSSQTDLHFTSISTTGDLGRFYGCYSDSTGIFTVPYGGLKNIQIRGQLNKAGLATSDLYIKINNTVYGAISPIGPSTQISYFVPSLSADDTIKLTILCADGTLTADSDASDQFDIFASN